jgi:hypothetical protein
MAKGAARLSGRLNLCYLWSLAFLEAVGAISVICDSSPNRMQEKRVPLPSRGTLRLSSSYSASFL